MARRTQDQGGVDEWATSRAYGTMFLLEASSEETLDGIDPKDGKLQQFSSMDIQ